jgi:DUF4097 and DUF4098 domain-containing protein YvlB
MRKNSTFAAIIILGAILVLWAPAILAQSEAEPEISRQAFQLNPGGSFSLKNVNGSVTIQAWDQPGVEIVSTKKGRTKEQMDMVKIEITADLQKISVDTIYPRGEHNLNVSVNYDVKVPRTTSLRNIDTVNGSVDIDGTSGEVNAQTVNGSIKVLNATGVVSAETVNGGISVELLKYEASAGMKLETVNGSIKLYLPDQAGADVTAETVNGSIHTDFPLTVEGKFGPKRLNGVLGKGGPRIRMSTVNGSLNLLRR